MKELTGTHSQCTQYMTLKGGPRSGCQVCSSSYVSPPNRHSANRRLRRRHKYNSDDGTNTIQATGANTKDARLTNPKFQTVCQWERPTGGCINYSKRSKFPSQETWNTKQKEGFCDYIFTDTLKAQAYWIRTKLQTCNVSNGFQVFLSVKLKSYSSFYWKCFFGLDYFWVLHVHVWQYR